MEEWKLKILAFRRVVGGVETAPHEFPWMVVIGTRDEKGGRLCSLG